MSHEGPFSLRFQHWTPRPSWPRGSRAAGVPQSCVGNSCARPWGEWLARAKSHQVANLIYRQFDIGHHAVVRQPQDEVAAQLQLVVALAIVREVEPGRMTPVAVNLHGDLPFEPHQVDLVAT